MEEQIPLFLEFIKNEKKLSDNTFESYKRDVTQFNEYLNVKNIDYINVEEKDIRNYLDYLKDKGKKATTISRHLASIRLFYQYSLKDKKVSEDPTINIQMPEIIKTVTIPKTLD